MQCEPECAFVSVARHTDIIVQVTEECDIGPIRWKIFNFQVLVCEQQRNALYSPVVLVVLQEFVAKKELIGVQHRRERQDIK